MPDARSANSLTVECWNPLDWLSFVVQKQREFGRGRSQKVLLDAVSRLEKESVLLGICKHFKESLIAVIERILISVPSVL